MFTDSYMGFKTLVLHSLACAFDVRILGPDSDKDFEASVARGKQLYIRSNHRLN